MLIAMHAFLFAWLWTMHTKGLIVNDMTNEAFLAMLRRFTDRRGIPHEVFTDCGTNFIGDEKILRKLSSTKQNTKLDIGS